MEKPLELDMGDGLVRFTPDGKIFVKDAIDSLLPEKTEESSRIWKKLQREHPEIMDHCEIFMINDSESIPTLDIDGLNKLFELLPDYAEGLIGGLHDKRF